VSKMDEENTHPGIRKSSFKPAESDQFQIGPRMPSAAHAIPSVTQKTRIANWVCFPVVDVVGCSKFEGRRLRMRIGVFYSDNDKYLSMISIFQSSQCVLLGCQNPLE
jgi:hypothetical protein